MTRVIVQPAGSGRETMWIGALCAAILVCAGTVATIRARPADQTVLPAWRIDARDGLNAAEQGLNADLAAAAEDIRAAMAEGDAPPSPERLAEDALPPFAKDVTTDARGGHLWSVVRDGPAVGYLGATSDPAAARSLLLRLGPNAKDSHEHQALAPSTVWAHVSAGSVDSLADERLIAAGWRQIASRYDASVTRERP